LRGSPKEEPSPLGFLTEDHKRRLRRAVPGPNAFMILGSDSEFRRRGAARQSDGNCAIRRMMMAKRNEWKILVLCFFSFLLVAGLHAQNEVLGEVQLVGATKVEKTSGVWIDGEYVGYLDELKGDKKILLLPGEHEISVRQSGYTDFTQKVTVEPHKKVILQVKMGRDPKVQFPTVTSAIKLEVNPDRAAVFLDGAFVGHVHEFGGVGRSMQVSPGKHTIKITLPGYQTFETEINLLPKQKTKIKTELVKGSITQADPLIKKD
jgi:PEGA domain